MIFNIKEELKNKHGIYIITNSINNKIYIGSAVNLKKRYRAHLKDLETKKHHSPTLQYFVNKYSIDTLTFSLLKEVKDKTKLTRIEQVYLDFYQPYESVKGYNHYRTAGSPLGHKYTDKQNKDKSERLKKINIDRPDLAEKQSQIKIEFYKNNSDIKTQISESLKEYYKDNIEAKLKQSEFIKQYHIDNKELMFEAYKKRSEKYFNNYEKILERKVNAKENLNRPEVKANMKKAQQQKIIDNPNCMDKLFIARDLDRLNNPEKYIDIDLKKCNQTPILVFKDGVLIDEIIGQTNAGKKYGVTKSTVRCLIIGKTKRTKGITFKYKQS